MYRYFLRRALLVAAISIASTAVAQDVAPDLLLKAVTADVIDIVKQSRGNLSQPRAVPTEELVERRIVPVFDFPRMTQSAVALNWRLATPAQRASLIREFRTLLVRTYTVAVRNYRDETFEFDTLNITAAGEAVVRSVVKQGAKTRVTIDYDMQKTGAGWKVHEIRMDGVNLIANYRNTFAARVADGGIEGLIKILADKNRQSSYAGSRPGATQDPS